MYRSGIIVKTPEQIEQHGRRRRDPGALPEDAAIEVPPGGRPPPSSTRPPRSSSASQDAVASFKGYRGFPGSICASPNSMVVHGIPGPYVLRGATCSRSTSA